MTIADLTYSEACERMRQIHDELEDLAASTTGDLSPADEARAERLGGEFNSINRHRQRLERCASLAGGGFRTERGSAGDYDVDPMRDPRSAEAPRRRYKNPWALSEIRAWGCAPHEVAAEWRGRALSAIELMPAASDRVRAAATKIIEEHDDARSTLSQFALHTSTPQYLRAWSKMAQGQHHLLTQDEAAAVDQVNQFRAMSLTDNQGGYLVPFQLDPSVIVTSDGVRNDIRQAARVVVATSDVWHGVSSGNVSWSFDAEASEVSDDSTAFAQPAIPNYMARGFVPISIEAMSDAANVTQEVGRLLVGGKMDLEGTKFITGSGTGEPTGIVTALTGTSSVVNAATDDTFALADVYTLQGALPARYRANASWLANNLIYNKIRQFDTAGGNGLWAQLGDGRPSVLLGRTALEAEAMDGTITTSGAGHNYALIFGDLSNFVITDRLGFQVELIPMLFHTSNNRPSGQRGWFAWYRTGSDSVNDGGMRMLDVVSAS